MANTAIRRRVEAERNVKATTADNFCTAKCPVCGQGCIRERGHTKEHTCKGNPQHNWT